MWRSTFLGRPPLLKAVSFNDTFPMRVYRIILWTILLYQQKAIVQYAQMHFNVSFKSYTLRLFRKILFNSIR